jgi:hypothetical protein
MNPESGWDKLKQRGSSHYKSQGVEPIDLYRSLGLFEDFALASIIKYAARQKMKGLNEADLNKIIHYAELLRSTVIDRDNGKTQRTR